MTNIFFRNNSYQCRNNETLLQAFLRQGVELKFSCQKGSCQVCMLHCTSSYIPEKSQIGLKPNQINQNYFLPCQCRPVKDMEIQEIEHNQRYHSAVVHKKDFLSENVCKLLIDCENIEAYKAGQFFNLCRPEDGLARSYSLASHSAEDYYLEIHVSRMRNGELSNWIFDELQQGDAVDIQGPMGENHSDNYNPDTPLLLIAEGTGLAPVMSVLKQVLSQGHKADINIFHESKLFSDLYLHDELSGLSTKHKNLNYFPCVTGQMAATDTSPLSALDAIHNSSSNFKDSLVHLVGTSNFVSELYEKIIQKGISDEHIYCDSFDLKNLRREKRNYSKEPDNVKEITPHSSVKEYSEIDYPEPDMQIWDALDDGKKLNKILDDFYTIVYDDPKLSPFFDKITKQRSIEKVYLFLRQIFTGEKVYFGDRPRNAHHWMVISDELFDYRENIMETCLRNNGLPEYLIKRWRSIEEAFRPDIVKDKPWNKVVNGVELPLEGYEELELDSGSLCDSCNKAIEVGTRVRYHLRLGSIYCPDCMVRDT